MEWFNYYGLIIIVIILIPNIVFALTHRESTENAGIPKWLSVLEQIGRYGCMALMIFNIPYTYFGFWFGYALAVYLCVNGALLFLYCLFWVLCRNSGGMLKALSLSIIPTAIFLFSGIMLLNIPLIIFSVLFGASHIFISCKNFSKKY